MTTFSFSPGPPPAPTAPTPAAAATHTSPSRKSRKRWDAVISSFLTFDSRMKSLPAWNPPFCGGLGLRRLCTSEQVGVRKFRAAVPSCRARTPRRAWRSPAATPSPCRGRRGTRRSPRPCRRTRSAELEARRHCQDPVCRLPFFTSVFCGFDGCHMDVTATSRFQSPCYGGRRPLRGAANSK
jgi:hypothetical protein